MNCGGIGPETCITLIAPEGGKFFFATAIVIGKPVILCCLLFF